jgi:hypothetical protein
MLVMLFSAAAVPLIAVPAWWANTARAFPLTAGIASLNNLMLDHRPISQAWGTGGLVPLLATAAGYLAAGMIAFRLGDHTAKRRGSLARY